MERSDVGFLLGLRWLNSFTHLKAHVGKSLQPKSKEVTKIGYGAWDASELDVQLADSRRGVS